MTPNGRITNRDLFDAITDLRKELKADINCVDQRIDHLVEDRGNLSERVAKAETDLEHLNRRVTGWDAGNTLGVIVAGILAYFGIRN